MFPVFSTSIKPTADWEGMKIQSLARSQHVRKNISHMFHSTLGVSARYGVRHRRRVPENIRFSAVALHIDGIEYA